jgi:hypothetical protein
MDNNIPLKLFALSEEGNIVKAVCGMDIGTTVAADCETELY